MEPSGQRFVDRLLTLARLGGLHDPSVDAVAEVLTKAGLRSASASSLRRARRGGNNLPRGEPEQFDRALMLLSNSQPGTEAVRAELRQMFVDAHAAANAQARADPRTADRRPRPVDARTVGYLPLPAERQELARLFLRQLDRWWIDRSGGDRLSSRKFAGAAQIGPGQIRRIRAAEVALPPDAFWRLVDDASPEARYSVCRAYLDAYRDLYAGVDRFAEYLRLIDRPLVRADPARRTEAVEALERTSRAGLREANRLLDTGDPQSAGLRLEDVYVPRRFTGNEEIHTEDDLLARCGPGSVSVIVGEPGTGKTSVLWRMAERLRATGRAVWLVSAGDLGSALPVADVATALLSAAAAAETGRSADTTRPTDGMMPADTAVGVNRVRPAGPVLLVDTVDLLLRSETLPPLVDDLVRAVVGANAALVMTCRVREYEILRPYGDELDFERVCLGPYSADELPVAVDKHARIFFADPRHDPAAITARVMLAVARGLPVEQICRVPLTLRMLFELHQLEWSGPQPPGNGTDGRDGVDTEIDVTDLFDKHWYLRVRTDARTNRTGTRQPGDGDTSAAAELLAVVMLAAGVPRVGQTQVARAMERVGDLLAMLDTLVRRGVVHRFGTNPVEFFHQTFFEYAAARAIVAMGADGIRALVERTLRQPDDAFLAAVTQQTLVFACRTGPDSHRADEAFAALLSDTTPGVQQTAIAAYAQARHRGPLTTRAARDLLRTAGTGLVRRYLVFLPRVRHEDLGSVLDDLTMAWQHDNDDVRAEVFDALRSLAVLDPAEILDAVTAKERPDWLSWYAELGPDPARQRRQNVLGLIEELARVDPDWCADRIEEIAEKVIQKVTSQDALAAVLTVAARVGLPADRLRRLLAVIPPDVKKDASGIDELCAAAAGIIRRVWLAEGTDPVTVAEALVGDESSAATIGAGHGWCPPAWLARDARLRALAELAHEREPAVVEDLLEVFLSWNDPQGQTAVANWFLRRLIEGEYRPALPGAPVPASSPAAKVTRKRCVTYLRRLSAPTNERGRRPVSALWREALDRAALPPVEVAAIAREVSDGDPTPGWLREDGLAAILVPAALGGCPTALRALNQWSGRSKPASGPRETTVRKIITYRLENLAARHAEAFEHLIRDGRVETDGTHVDGAVTKMLAGGGTLPDRYVEPVTSLVHDLLASRIPDTRRDGYAIAATAIRGRGVATATIICGLRTERGIRSLRATLNLLDATLEHDPGRWSEPTTFTLLDQVLDDLAKPGAAPDPGLGRRALASRCVLYCHSGALGTPADRRNTVDRVRQLILDANEPELLSSVGRLMSRMARADPIAAGDLLVEASRIVNGMTVADTTNSWKARRARRWRRGIFDVVVKLPYGPWKRVLDRLGEHDPQIFAQAIDASVRERTENVERHIRSVLRRTRPDAKVEAGFTSALTRRQRITGGTTVWPELLDSWLAEPSRLPGTF